MVKLKEQLKLTRFYWTPKHITAIRKRSKLSKERFAHQLGCSVRTVYHWEANKAQPSQAACKILTDFEEKNNWERLMKPMTRQESIDGCMKQWEFYAETGTKDKAEYSPAKGIKNHCYFCEYALDENYNCVKGKNRCPGLKYWAPKRGWGFCMDNPSTGLNYSHTSLYIYWKNAKTTKERKLWASRIVWMIWLIGQDDLTVGKK